MKLIFSFLAFALALANAENIENHLVDPMDLDSLAAAKAAPWWNALRAANYYGSCKSSCIEDSKGTTTRVELCDDTKVLMDKYNSTCNNTKFFSFL